MTEFVKPPITKDPYAPYTPSQVLEEIPAYIVMAYAESPQLTMQWAPSLVEFIRASHADIARNTLRAPVNYMLDKLSRTGNSFDLPEVQRTIFIDHLMQELATKGLSEPLFDNTQTAKQSYQYRHTLIDALKSQKWSFKEGVDLQQVAKNVADTFERKLTQPRPPLPLFPLPPPAEIVIRVYLPLQKHEEHDQEASANSEGLSSGYE